MEKNKSQLINTCNFAGARPIMADLPYPPIQVREKNQAYADLLSVDYCGSVSELSAIAQYINNENRMSGEKCSLAKTILGIAMAEMMHLQKLGELILLLGGNVDFTAKLQNGRCQMWTPGYINIPQYPAQMLEADIEEERRLFYVGMTRAKNRLHLFYVRERYGSAMERSEFLDGLIRE